MTKVKMNTPTNRIVAGIDYGMSSPVLCVHEGKDFKFENCKFFYVCSKKSKIINDDIFCGVFFKKPEVPEERFDFISSFFLSKLKTNPPEFLLIEGYSYGSKGMVFEIGENTGVLKNKLWKEKYKFSTIAPPTLKKFATGSGKAKKPEMIETLIDHANFDLYEFFDIEKDSKDLCPLDDIADAFFLTKRAFELLSS